MPIPLDLLHSIGTSALPLIAGSGMVVVEVGSSIVVKVWEWWGKKTQEAERRKELEALASATAQELRGVVKELSAQIAADHPPQMQSKLEGYLLAVPAQIRRTLRRPSDFSGCTVPADLNLKRAEDLTPLLPPRPPRYTGGEKAPGTDFELIELLGIGGFGEVWKARNSYMPGAPAVALKFCIDPEAATSLRRETTLLDRIQREGKHPGIVELRHTFLSADPPFLEYELVEGGDLGGLIGEWHRLKGGPTSTEAAYLIRQLAETVAFAHSKGIVHRDLKPANVLLSGSKSSNPGAVSSIETIAAAVYADGATPLAPMLKIADFGIGGVAAEAAARQALFTRAGGTLTAAAAHGSYSLYYASPEQMRGAPADPRDDVHALGVIWYQLLVGDLMAEAPRGAGWKKRLTARGMPTPLIDLLEACVASDREDRPANAREIADQIGFVITPPALGIDLPSTAPPVPTTRQQPHEPANEKKPTTGDPPGMLGGFIPRHVIEKELQKNRWNEFVSRLRQLRLGQDRLRWADGLLTWMIPILVIIGAGVGTGFLASIGLGNQSRSANQALGQSIATQYSTTSIPIHFRSWGTSGDFELRYPQYRTVGSNSTDPQAFTSTSTGGFYPTGYEATITPIVAYGVPPQTMQASVDKYIHEVNSKLATAAEQYNQQCQGRNDLLFSILSGAGAFLLLLIGFLLLRRWAYRSLERSNQELQHSLQGNFAAELRELPQPLDLTLPGATARIIAALEASEGVNRPLPNPIWLWRRFLAPF